jgi:hypothetical protein
MAIAFGVHAQVVAMHIFQRLRIGAINMLNLQNAVMDSVRLLSNFSGDFIIKNSIIYALA